MWCPMLLGLIYMIFNLLYIVAFDGTFDGHDYVYPVLDWNNKLGQTMLLVCLSFVGLQYFLAFFTFGPNYEISYGGNTIDRRRNQNLWPLPSIGMESTLSQ